MKLKIISVKSAIAVMAALFSLGACFLYGSNKAGVFFASVFLAAGCICFVKESAEDPKEQIIYLSLMFLIFSFLTVFICQRVLNEGTFEIGLLRLLLNMAVCLIVFLVFFSVTLCARISVFLSSGLLVFLTTANYYVFLFRGSEINPADFLSIGTAANVAAEYRIIPNGPIVYAWLLLILTWFFLFSFPKILVRQSITTRIKVLVSILFCALLIMIGSGNIQILHFMQTGSVMNGYLLNFVLQIQETIITPPDGYSADNIRYQEIHYGEKETDKEERPDIFIIMDESFADLSILGSDLKTNMDVIPFVSSLEENTIKGYALSSVFGGGTPNSEYEFLSGNSMFFLPTGAIVFQQYIDKPSYSMIYDFKELNYYCVAMHPCFSNGWERNKVYPLLGYDECWFLDDYPRENMVRNYVSDQEAFEVMIQKYEEIKTTDGRNTFMFLVTMQNHGAYTYEGDNYEQTIELEDYHGEYPDAEQYLTLINKTDRALNWMINYLQTLEHDAVLVFYGDHLPKLDDRFYQEIHGGDFGTLDEQNLLQTVPFFIWTNYDIEEEKVNLTSLNFLSNYMYKAAKIEMPAYNQYLSYVEENIPAINATGYYSKEDSCFKKYAEADGSEAAVLKEYHQFVYNCMFDSKEKNKHFFPIEE